jgi:hypothetical protein
LTTAAASAATPTNTTNGGGGGGGGGSTILRGSQEWNELIVENTPNSDLLPGGGGSGGGGGKTQRVRRCVSFKTAGPAAAAAHPCDGRLALGGGGGISPGKEWCFFCCLYVYFKSSIQKQCVNNYYQNHQIKYIEPFLR